MLDKVSKRENISQREFHGMRRDEFPTKRSKIKGSKDDDFGRTVVQ